MAFIPAHNAAVKIALEVGSITESTDGVTAATLPAVPTTAVLGYTNLPQGSRGLGNSKGYAIGNQGASYRKKGRVEPSVSFELRVTSADALALFFPTTGVLPSLCVQVIAAGNYTDTYRFCKPSNIEFRYTTGEEVVVSVSLQAIAYVRTDTGTFTPSELLALGSPLFWSDVRTFTVGGTSYRRALMSLNATIDYGLERKNERPDFGDDVPTSRTSYALLEHHITVSGEIGLHERLPASLFTGGGSAQEWGNIVIFTSNSTTIGQAGFTLTFTHAQPSDESMQGAESSAEIDHTVPFTASLVTMEVEDLG